MFAITVVVFGILATPWIQVVEEQTRIEESVYTATHTYSNSYTSTVVTSTALTESTTILDLNDVPARGMGTDRRGPAYSSKRFQLKTSQMLYFDFRVTRDVPSCPPPYGLEFLEGFLPCVYLVLAHDPAYPYRDWKWILVTVFLDPLTAELVLADPGPVGVPGYPGPDSTRYPNPVPILTICSDCETIDWYIVGVYNRGSDPAYFDLKLIAQDTIPTRTTYVTTFVSEELKTLTLTSTMTTTWYNTTYKRPLG